MRINVFGKTLESMTNDKRQSNFFIKGKTVTESMKVYF